MLAQPTYLSLAWGGALILAGCFVRLLRSPLQKYLFYPQIISNLLVWIGFGIMVMRIEVIISTLLVNAILSKWDIKKIAWQEKYSLPNQGKSKLYATIFPQILPIPASYARKEPLSFFSMGIFCAAWLTSIFFTIFFIWHPFFSFSSNYFIAPAFGLSLLSCIYFGYNCWKRSI